MKQQTRSQYTKQLFIDSFKSLLQRKPFSKISISEIVNDCNLNRKTFYYHFTDIYDLLDYLLQQEFYPLFEPLPNVYDFETFKKIFEISLKCLEESSYLSSCAENMFAYEHLVLFFQKNFEPILLDLTKQLEQNYNISLDVGYKNFLITTFSRSGGLIIMDQLKNHTYDSDELLSYLDSFYFSFDGIFANFSNT